MREDLEKAVAHLDAGRVQQAGAQQHRDPHRPRSTSAPAPAAPATVAMPEGKADEIKEQLYAKALGGALHALAEGGPARAPPRGDSPVSGAPRVAVSMGDPTGIGPEVTLAALLRPAGAARG